VDSKRGRKEKMSWKEDFITKRGNVAYARKLERRREWGRKLPGGEAQRGRERRSRDPEKFRECSRRWAKNHPEKVRDNGRRVSRKGGTGYKKKQIYKQAGISGERERVRMRHGYYWRKYKNIIAPGSELHHSWIPGTSNYTGLAIVEMDAHRHGIIEVIQILEGKITLFTENEIRKEVK
jgi:hypothetical protein